MIDRKREGTDAALHDHESHLPHRRVAKRLLDVVLRQHQDRADQRRHETHDEKPVQNVASVHEYRRKAVDQETAGVDDTRMHQGRNRRRPAHGVGQPGVQQKLRGASESRKCDQRRHQLR